MKNSNDNIPKINKASDDFCEALVNAIKKNADPPSEENPDIISAPAEKVFESLVILGYLRNDPPVNQ